MKKIINKTAFDDTDILHVACDCGWPGHMLVITSDKDADGHVYFSLVLTPGRSFWGRVVQSLKYIFGNRSVEELVLSREAARELGRDLASITVPAAVAASGTAFSVYACSKCGQAVLSEQVASGKVFERKRLICKCGSELRFYPEVVKEEV